MWERLERLEGNLKELERLRSSLRAEDLRTGREKEWAVRYGLLECIQIVIDVSCYLASDRNLGSPRSYAECIHLLRENGYLPPELAERLVRMVGLRNLLVHEYLEVEPETLLSFLAKLDDFREFATRIRDHL